MAFKNAFLKPHWGIQVFWALTALNSLLGTLQVAPNTELSFITTQGQKIDFTVQGHVDQSLVH